MLLVAACTSPVDQAQTRSESPDTTLVGEQPGTTVDTTDTTQGPADNDTDYSSVRECIEASGYNEEDLVNTPGTKIRSWEEAKEDWEYLGYEVPSEPPPGEGHFELIVDIDEYNRWQRTEAACVEVTTGDQPARDPVAEAAHTEYALAVDACMRDLGWDFPDPWPNPWGTGYRPIMVGRDMVPIDQEEREAFMADLGDCSLGPFEEYLEPLFSPED